MVTFSSPVFTAGCGYASSGHTPKCPVYQNVDALPHTNPEEIKANLIAQLTSPVRWTQSVLNMRADGAETFT